MKKFLVVIFFVFLFITAFEVYKFYDLNLRGAHFALGPTVADITKVNKEEEGTPAPENTTSLPLVLPDGFHISVFAQGLGAPRVIAFDPQGIILVSVPAQGTVVALPDRNGDGIADKTVTVISGLNKPHGLAFYEGKLYIAETDQVALYDYDPITMKATNKKKIIDLPGGGNHFSRTIGFGPDGRLYIALGSSCNVCNEKDSRRASILVADPDGSNVKTYATGLRNSVFLVWNTDGRMWATEMGRDLLGDDMPPDEINIISEGGNYGWPVCYGKNIHDTNFDKNTYIRDPCSDMVPPAVELQAHSAPLGLAFVPVSQSSQWPSDYYGNLIVAFHGSWNRTKPTGYKLVRIKLDAQGNYLGTEDFITGWISDEGVFGRPVDVVVRPDGAMYVSDDKAGVIYKITYAP